MGECMSEWMCGWRVKGEGSTVNLPHQADNIVLKIRDSAVISFPNLRVALQILITLAVSFASSECSFSKVILAYLLGSMGQIRISNLEHLNIEGGDRTKYQHRSIIDQFAAIKVKKQSWCQAILVCTRLFLFVNALIRQYLINTHFFSCLDIWIIPI